MLDTMFEQLKGINTGEEDNLKVVMDFYTELGKHISNQVFMAMTEMQLKVSYMLYLNFRKKFSDKKVREKQLPSCIQVSIMHFGEIPEEEKQTYENNVVVGKFGRK